MFSLLLALGIALAPSPITAVPSPPTGACWTPPVEAPISDPYRKPSCLWCPGNRGIEFGSVQGDVVKAVAAGTVTFAGRVAGTNYVVVEHPDGLRATYGGLTTINVRPGNPVLAGLVVGVAAGSVHFGLRRGEEYLDPTPFLGVPTWRARLIPHDGAPPRPVPPPTMTCGQ